MGAAITSTADGQERRLLLVDFDWQDADLMPELLQRPGVSVRLVAGAQQDDAGIRLAELCGLPRTVELADLTREIFDLALVSERSPRRSQIEGLLLALGTPTLSPQAFLAGERAPVAVPAEDRPAAEETGTDPVVAAADLEALLDEALPDVSTAKVAASESAAFPVALADAPAAPAEATGSPAAAPVTPWADFPGPEDRHGLEAFLARLVTATGARRAEMRLVGPDEVETVLEVGPADTLLRGLVQIADELGSSQVVGGLAGSQRGKAWGAWPFRTTQRHGVIAAGAITPTEAWTTWERVATELRDHWDRRDRELAGPAFPLLPARRARWLRGEEFAMRLELAVERNRRDGLRFSVHRIHLPGPAPVAQALCQQLPGRLRDSDCLARSSAQVVLLLTAGTPASFTHVRSRLTALWEQAWSEAGEPQPAPALRDEHVQLICPADEGIFLSTAKGWATAGEAASA